MIFGILHDMLAVTLVEDLPVHSSQSSLGWGLLCDETRAPMPQTRPQFNAMPLHSNQRQHHQYHKSHPPQQQPPKASFHHIVDPNPSSIGYYEQANPQPVSTQVSPRYRTFAA